MISIWIVVISVPLAVIVGYAIGFCHCVDMQEKELHKSLHENQRKSIGGKK